MFWLRLRMFLLVAVMFSIIYAVVAMVAAYMGISNFYFYLTFSLILFFLQYMISPKLIEWSMKVRYLSKNEAPELHAMISDLARRANMPLPKIGIAQIPLPNAFAFGRWRSDGRICVTQGVLDLLNAEELKAVLGHEITHLKSRDVLVITILSVIPLILYRIAVHIMFFGGGRSRRSEGSAPVLLIGLASFLFYFITNLLVLYASRIREYFADQGSVNLGNRPHQLASALYKLVYGSARTNKDALRQVEGLKAFFVNDPSRALYEIKELKSLDKDLSGSIDAAELLSLRVKNVRLSFGDRLMEAFSTHPNMLKRIKKLSTYHN